MRRCVRVQITHRACDLPQPSSICRMNLLTCAENRLEKFSAKRGSGLLLSQRMPSDMVKGLRRFVRCTACGNTSANRHCVRFAPENRHYEARLGTIRLVPITDEHSVLVVPTYVEPVCPTGVRPVPRWMIVFQASSDGRQSAEFGFGRRC
jgi:hypothetical protein